MAPTPKNQPNSVYQAPLGQSTGHRTSIVSIVILLIIAIIIAVLGFERIKTIKDEDAKLKRQQQAQTETVNANLRAQQAQKERDANMMSELESIGASGSSEDITAIEASF
jgi:predicted metalloprotease